MLISKLCLVKFESLYLQIRSLINCWKTLKNKKHFIDFRPKNHSDHYISDYCQMREILHTSYLNQLLKQWRLMWSFQSKFGWPNSSQPNLLPFQSRIHHRYTSLTIKLQTTTKQFLHSDVLPLKLNLFKKNRHFSTGIHSGG